VVRNVTKTEAFATGFAAAFSVSGLEGSGMTAAAMWRPTTAAVNAAAINTAAVNSAQHQTVAFSPNHKLATLHTQIKQYVVTTPNTGRGNKGTSPWGFPV
jgi:NAD(P)H-dependent FMN reductase